MTFWEISDMSFESRTKKLRGSGGYIMASINDELQRKGNLGGPDLFLAPVGRIDSEKISKFYCNTCEKDYEGAPRIQFENPNEEVAENLILVEKGQYICTTCGSTLAEYREFKKPNEAIDTGNARPMTPRYDSIISPSKPIQQSFPSPSPTVTIPDFDSQMLPSSNLQEDIVRQSQQTNSSFNAIAGMTAYDEKAKRMGIVKQVGVDATQNVVLIITKNDGSEVSIIWMGLRVVFGTENPFYVVSSGSMIPELQVFDVLVVQGNDPFESVKIGDVIVFDRPEGQDRVIVHRVAAILNEEPYTIRTKGDANPASIPGTDFPITEKEYIGKVAYVIPQVGYVTRVLTPPINYIIIAIIIAVMIGKQLRKTKKEHELSDSFDFDSKNKDNQLPKVYDIDILDDKEYSKDFKKTESSEPELYNEKISESKDYTDAQSKNSKDDKK